MNRGDPPHIADTRLQKMARDMAHHRAPRSSHYRSAFNGDLVWRPVVDFAKFGLSDRQIPRALKAAPDESGTLVDMRRFLVAIHKEQVRRFLEQFPEMKRPRGGFQLPGGGEQHFRRASGSGAWTDDPGMRFVWMDTEYALDGGFVVGRQAIAGELGMTVSGLESWIKNKKSPQARLLIKTATRPTLWLASLSAIVMLDQMRSARWRGDAKRRENPHGVRGRFTKLPSKEKAPPKRG